jgi:hypothetical protein
MSELELDKRFPLYSRALKLYPHDYQDHYGHQMLQTLADMLDHAETSTQQQTIWLRTIADYPFSLVWQQLNYFSEPVLDGTPHYVRRNSFVSLMALVPFLIIVPINDLSGHGLYHSLLWNTTVFYIWILLLPLAAMILNAITLATWARQDSKVRHKQWYSSLLDIRRSWPMLVLTALSCIILGAVFLLLSRYV